MRTRSGLASQIKHRDRPFGTKREEATMRDIILWFAGVPIVVIIGLHVLGLLH
jgi:hypothetical protein